MNERIKELAEQAEQRADKIILSEKVLKSDEDWFSVFKQQFAELIVRECLHIVDDERDSTDSEFGKLVAEGCALKIMERFGVEE